MARPNWLLDWHRSSFPLAFRVHADYVYGKGRDFAARGCAQGVQVSTANARQGLSGRLHSAAAKALEGLK